LCAFPLQAQSQANLHGKIVDPLGNPIPNAKIVLLQGDKEIAQGKSDAEGSFDLAVPDSGRYTPRVEARGFATQALPPVVLKAGKAEELTVSMRIGPLVQQIVISATGTATPEAQVGASVTLIDSDQINTLNKLDVLEDLRLVPGAQIVQTSQRGGATSMFIRGGESNFNKVLVDGIPVNAIGGNFDYAQLSNSGVGSVEVLRGANSVLYGSDALGGVVNITSARGTTAIPELNYSVDGGNFGTLNQNVALGGAIHKFDYFSEFSRFDTSGSYPNDFFHNATVSANLGWDLAPTTGFRVTVRHTATDLGTPNAIDFYGISDLSTQRTESTYVGFTAQQQTTNRWHNSAQFAFGQNTTLIADRSPVGQIDPYGDYLGNLVTIRGANGYSVTGQAILDYGVYSGVTYPAVYPYYEARRSVYAESDYRFFGDWTGIAGFRYEHEDGNDDAEIATRDNYSSFLEAHGSVAHRLFLTTGVGLEHNGVFGFAASPRVSVAYYLRSSSASGFFGDTKLKFNFGKGIKEPSISDQLGSLYDVLTPAQIAEYHVSPTGPERSKTYDFGVEQRVWNGRALIGATFFYNDFYDIIAYLNAAALESLGLSPGEIADLPGGAFGGATVNATSTRALGSELEFKADLGHGLFFQGEYTYLDAVVTKAFETGVTNPDCEPNCSTILIGDYSPLQGARPFRLAPHSGSLILTYSRNKLTAALSGSLVSRRDDSTFLSDANYGYTMLLPNRNLAPAYQKFDLSVSYAVTSYAKVYTSMENLFSQHYDAAFGYPALPFAIRSGITFTLGGHGGWWQ
jgi:iron complex outermembrane receptor protein/vitamin B12 transporter